MGPAGLFLPLPHPVSRGGPGSFCFRRSPICQCQPSQVRLRGRRGHVQLPLFSMDNSALCPQLRHLHQCPRQTLFRLPFDHHSSRLLPHPLPKMALSRPCEAPCLSFARPGLLVGRIRLQQPPKLFAVQELRLGNKKEAGRASGHAQSASQALDV